MAQYLRHIARSAAVSLGIGDTILTRVSVSVHMKNNMEALRECLFDAKDSEIIKGDGTSGDDTPPLFAKDLLPPSGRWLTMERPSRYVATVPGAIVDHARHTPQH